ncbi:hypothetical protein J2X69_003208 [Algoriphagus sp. 4150]|nr:hypothetical protein [Algoriphagus sp. 4150]
MPQGIYIRLNQGAKSRLSCVDGKTEHLVGTVPSFSRTAKLAGSEEKMILKGSNFSITMGEPEA